MSNVAMAAAREKIQKVLSKSYQEPLGFINLPFDTSYHTEIMAVVHAKKKLNPSLVFLIGIGGSNLGTLAVHEALHGLYYNETTQGAKFYCADAVDVAAMLQLKEILEKALQCGQAILLIIVSKSGTTTETSANAQFFFDLLQHYHPHNYANYIVAITDKDSVLWRQADALGCAKLAVPQEVGGRFSVLSAVGLFPLAMLGINIEELCAGARRAVEDSVAAVERAQWLFEGLQQGYFINDLFLFDKSYAALGAWYRQLIAESLGKEKTYNMVPTITMAVDLHSQIQLYFAGSHIRQTTFVLPDLEENVLLHGTAFCVHRDAVQVQKIIAEGVQRAYTNEGLRSTKVVLQKDAASLGHWLQSAMLEIFYLGQLMQVNVFDQPQVELYKKEIRLLLS